MSLRFIVDGYNVMRRSGAFEAGSLEAQRRAFLGWLETARPQGSARNSVTIVFDGKEEGGVFETPSGTRIIYTPGTTADDRIKEMVEGSSGVRDIVVVSDDKEVICYVRRLGARPMSSRDFMKTADSGRAHRPPRRSFETAERGPGAAELERITEEVRRIWLKKK
jgi:predicted RNA-binding protein with PIN domain